MRYKYTSITRNNDFCRAYSRGKSYVHPLLVLYVNKNRAGEMRVGITTSKKIGNAVARARARRVIRAAMREALPQNVIKRDIVFVARAQTGKVKSQQIASVMKKLLLKAGVIAAEGLNGDEKNC